MNGKAVSGDRRDPGGLPESGQKKLAPAPSGGEKYSRRGAAGA